VQIKRKKLFAYLFESFASVSPQPQEKKTKKKKKNKTKPKLAHLELMAGFLSAQNFPLALQT